MHEQAIIDEIISRLHTDNCHIFAVSLVCSEQELTRRLQKDIKAAIRTCDVLERSIARIPLYQQLNTVKIDTSGKSPHEIADEIVRKLHDDQ